MADQPEAVLVVERGIDDFSIVPLNQPAYELARIHRWTRTEGVRTQEGGVRKLQTRWPGLEFG